MTWVYDYASSIWNDTQDRAEGAQDRVSAAAGQVATTIAIKAAEMRASVQDAKDAIDPLSYLPDPPPAGKVLLAVAVTVAVLALLRRKR